MGYDETLNGSYVVIPVGKLHRIGGILSRVVNKLKHMLLTLLFQIGFFRLAFFSIKLFSSEKIGVVLIYHHLRSGTDTNKPISELETGVTETAFQRYVKYLAGTFTLTTMSQLLDSVNADDGKKGIVVAITFDDGYRSVYRYGFPILRRYSAPATVYLPSGYIDNKRRFWWLETSAVFRTISVSDFQKLKDELVSRCPDNKLERILSTVDLDSAADRARIRRAVSIYIGKLSENERQRAMEAFSFCPSNQDDPDTLVLRSEEIREMLSCGFEFGSHTVNHVDLTSLDQDGVLREIQQSKDELENRLNTRIVGLAYPYGRVNNQVLKLTTRAGYSYGVTTKRGIVTAATNRLEVPRINIGLDISPAQLASCILRELLKNFRQLIFS